MSEKLYCGNGRQRNFDNGGSVVNITIDVDVLAKAFKDFGWTTEAGKRKIKITLGENSRGADQYGNTHYCAVDTWKPDPNRQVNGPQSAPIENKQPSSPPTSFEDDIPFLI